MNSTLQLLKKLLPGLLPLIVFIVADELWGTRVGLIVAIASGVAELIIVGIREKRVDRFIIFDTMLLTAMGGVSIILDNEIFFKIKPGIINLIFCVVLGFSAFSDKNFLLLYSKRYLKDVAFGDEQQRALKSMTTKLFWFMLLYTALVFYSAFFMSREMWAFISGGLFYLLFGVIFIVQLVSGRIRAKKYADTEWLPIVDDEGKIIGKAPRDVVHGKPGTLHPVVHLHVLNDKGEIYLQKRPLHKLIQPGKWDTAVGGHISFGEQLEEALKREASEEIGLIDFHPALMARYRWDSDVESELVFSFVCRHNGELKVNRNEVDKGRFWRMSEIRENMGKGIFTPNFEEEFGMLIQFLSRQRVP